MKKIAKLSLITAVAIAGFTTSASADSLAEAFAASKVKGEIRAQYFAEDYEAAAGKENSDISLLGGSLGIKTGSYYGLYAGATFYTSHVIDKDDVDGITKKDEDVSGSVLAEAYLAYSVDNTTLKIGRQHLKTPLLGNSSSRLIKDSFEAITLVNTDLPDTTIVVGYVDKMSTRADQAGNVGKFEQVSKDGAYTLLIANKSIENLALTAQYATVQDTQDADLMFLEASYKLGDVKLSAEYLGSDNGNTTNSNGSMYGLKADANISGLSITGAYTSTDDETDVLYGLGEGSYVAYTKLTVGSGKNAYKADTDAYMIKASYKISDVKLGLGYASYDFNTSNTEKTESEITLAYALNKNTSIGGSYSTFGKDDTKDSEARVNLSYKF
jgi:imipenem/basic amino acid-specific outer membrane pore